MKRWLKRIGIFFLIVVAMIMLLIKLSPLLFLGEYFLNLFGVIKYEPPLSQSTKNIVQVDLLDNSGQECIIQYSITGDELDQFIDDYMEIDTGKFVNDPIVEHGRRIIRINYADGGYDLHGDMVEFYSPTGEKLPTGGWFHIDRDDMELIFDKYID